MKPKVIDRINDQDKVLDDKIGVLNDDRGYLNSKPIVDCNLAISNGKYTCTSGVNVPSTGNWIIDVTQEVDRKNGIQVATCYFGVSVDKQYYRHFYSDGTFGEWQQLATSTTTDLLQKQLSALISGDTPVGKLAQPGVEPSDMNDLSVFEIGKTVRVGYSTGVNQTIYNTPYGEITNGYSVTTYYNVFTFGISTRATQIASSAYSHNPNCFIRYKHDSNWSKWQQIATTTKTPFSCTANSGFTILSQDCHVKANNVYITCLVQKTDGSILPTNVVITPINVPTVYVPNEVCVNASYRKAGYLIDGGTTGEIGAKGNANVKVLENGVYALKISCVYSL